MNRDYKTDPIKFVEQVLGVELQPWQRGLMKAIISGNRVCYMPARRQGKALIQKLLSGHRTGIRRREK